jgi:hypothetical protein
MKTLLNRMATALRVWLGLADPSEDARTPAHGWLLPDPERLLSLRKLVPVTAVAARRKA